MGQMGCGEALSGPAELRAADEDEDTGKQRPWPRASAHALEVEQILLSSMNENFSRVHFGVRTFGIALVILFAIAPGVASATRMTLTFDDGAYDETILYPGGNLHGPYDWVESNGIRAAGFWAVDVGTPSAFFQLGHTHVQPNFSGRPDGQYERMHSWTSDLQGLYISLESGVSFDVISIDYSIKERDTTTPDLQRLDWAAGPDDAQLLLSTSFDPTASNLESQWTQFAIDDKGLPYTPWFTQLISGFEGVDGFYLSHTLAGLAIDSIVLEVQSASSVPEPTSALLVGLGLVGLATRRSRRS